MKKEFKSLIYVCAPYAGDIENNVKRASNFAKFIYEKGCIPLTSHLLFPFLDDKNKKERDDALFMDIVFLGKCDEVWVLGSYISKGMSKELEIAKKRRQTIRYFEDDFKEVRNHEGYSNRV